MPLIVRLALVFAAGATFGSFLGAANIVYAVAAAPVLLLFSLRNGESAALAGFALLAIGLSVLHKQRTHLPCRNYADGADVVVTGALLAQPTEVQRSVPLRVRGANACNRPIRVRLPDDAVELNLGDEVRVAGKWMVLRIAVDAQAPSDGMLIGDEAVRAADAHPDVLLAARARTQQRIRAIFPTAYPLAEALLISQREALSPPVKESFAASGLTHLLAISGSHVALVAAALMLIARLLRLSARAASFVSILGSAAYVFFLGAPYAALRSLIQLTLLLASLMLQRPAHPLGMLAAAALIICIIDPSAPLDAGFQLSFAGIYGILMWRRPLIDIMPSSLPHALRDAMATTCAATAITTPIAAYHFGVVSVISLLANLLAGPVVAVAVPVTAAALALSAVNMEAAGFLAGGAELSLLWLYYIAHKCASVPGGHFVVTQGSVLAVTGGVLLAWYAFAARPRSTVVTRLVFATLAFVLPITLAPIRTVFSGRVELHMIDVGQGDAVAIRSPKGRWLLVDAGPRSEKFDAGKSRVVPFLLRHNANRIEAFMISHPHLDHFGGGRAVLHNVRVASIIDPVVPVTNPEFDSLLAKSRQQRVTWFRARAGEAFELDGMRIEFLAPDTVTFDASFDPNDYSAAFRLSYGRFSALFLGDLSVDVERRMVSAYGGSLDVDVLKVGHHGSATSSATQLLAVTTPAVALISAGRSNRYGHPSPSALERLNAAGARVFRTDRDGTVSLSVGRDGRMTVRTAQ